METPSMSGILEEFSPIFDQCRRLWTNWSPSWNAFFAPDFFVLRCLYQYYSMENMFGTDVFYSTFGFNQKMIEFFRGIQSFFKNSDETFSLIQLKNNWIFQKLGISSITFKKILKPKRMYGIVWFLLHWQDESITMVYDIVRPIFTQM